MRSLFIAFASLLLAAACGGSDPAALADSGVQSLRSGDYSSALASFESALSAIGGDTAHPEYKRAKMGEIEARLHKDAERAKNDFLELHKALKGAVTDRDFQRIANAMGGARKFTEAIALLEAGKTAYPTSETLDKLGHSLVKLAKQAGDESATNALAGLGYL